jgi:hypothetical protein
MTTSATVGERLGVALGWAVAPAFALVSRARRARTFHPRGDAFLADVTALPQGGALGAALAGPALVRLSGALWKSQWEHLDVLGCALRFRRQDDPSIETGPDDQDVLFATILRPWTMGVAPFTTDASDYLRNDYYAVSPFDVPGFGRAFLRLRTEPRRDAPGGTRSERLDAAVAGQRAVFTLEVRRRWRRRWEPVARVELRERADVNQEALAFSPFRDGRGLTPRGFVHALRRGVYVASQRARPRG